MARPLLSRAERGGRVSQWIQRAPSPDLEMAVESVWVGVGGWRRRIRLLPDGCVDVVWNGEALHAFPASAVALHRDVAVGRRIVGVRVRCGWAGAILGGPLSVLAGREVRIEALLGARARECEAELRASADAEEVGRRLEQLVRDGLCDRREPDTSVLEAVQQLTADPAARLQDVARNAVIGPRELRRRFGDAVGLSPKRLQRVLRFAALMRRLDALAAGRERAAALAAELGYADQAHMVRECRAISGSTPGELARAQPA